VFTLEPPYQSAVWNQPDLYSKFLALSDRKLRECMLISLRNGHAFSDVLHASSMPQANLFHELSLSQLFFP